MRQEAMITEVEAYRGLEDNASHASRGLTPRTHIMFDQGGVWYVYLIYGMYHCLNIVTERQGYPAAVLIRSVTRISGPGRICKFFSIDRALNGKQAIPSNGLWIEDRGIQIVPAHIKKSPRIGVDYAGVWAQKPWRFFISPEEESHF